MLAAAGVIFLSLTEANAQKYSGSPVTKVRLIKAIQSKQFAVPILVKQIQISGVDFELTSAVEGELAAVRANQLIVAAVRDNYRYKGQATGRTGALPPKTPVTPDRDISGENYERLYYQGLETLNMVRTATNVAQIGNISRSAIDIGNQAIRLLPNRPEAYTLVAGAYLITRNFIDTQRYGQMAIDHGGNLSFPVYHLTASPHLEILYIGKGFVTIESNQEYFQFSGSEVTNPRPENNYFYNGVSVAVFSFQTYKNSRADIWYFTPGNTGTSQEAGMIMDLIRRNAF